MLMQTRHYRRGGDVFESVAQYLRVGEAGVESNDPRLLFIDGIYVLLFSVTNPTEEGDEPISKEEYEHILLGNAQRNEAARAESKMIIDAEVEKVQNAKDRALDKLKALGLDADELRALLSR